jgi:adenosylmethionine---8-amino-7-oxononanoate aminotransferase
MSLTPSRPIWRPYTQEASAPPPLALERAEGAYLFDRQGRRIFDGISSWWLITHGHCHPEIVEAVQRQAGRLDQVTFANFTHEPAEELAEQLIRVTPPELTRVFFSDNGSTAVEVALKMALQASLQRGQPERQKFLAFAGAYHGDTVGAMSVSGASPFNRPYQKNLFEVIRAKHPLASGMAAEEYTRDFELLLEENHRSLAGVIVEPIVQGAGGMIVWPELAVRRIAELCRKFGVFLIFDEVMTGFGRTGTLFAMDRLGTTPDLVCLSKGLTGGTLPLAVTLAREEIYQAFLAEDKSRMLFHGHSFTGNPLACAAALASLRIFQRAATLEAVQGFGKIHQQGFSSLARKLPVSGFRSCGTIAAFECGEGLGYLSGKLGGLTQAALAQGLFVRPLGPTVYLMPAYCSREQELLEVWEQLAIALNKLA